MFLHRLFFFFASLEFEDSKDLGVGPECPAYQRLTVCVYGTTGHVRFGGPESPRRSHQHSKHA